MEEKKEKTVHELKLHETVTVYTDHDDPQEIIKYQITRVFGGYIYQSTVYGSAVTSVFVPHVNTCF